MAEPLEQTGELAWPEFIKTRVVAKITRSSVTDRLEVLNPSLLIRLRRKGNNIYSYILKKKKKEKNACFFLMTIQIKRRER